VTQLSDVRPPGSRPGAPLLEVEDLSVVFTRRGRRDVRAVDGVTFSVHPGETVGLVGESGSGKSVTSLALMRLLPSRGAHVGGRVTFDGMDLLSLPAESMRDLRGRDMAMVFQDPMSSLNPVLTVGRQITEVLRRHRGMRGDEARDEAVTLLSRVGIPDPARRVREYPHQLSGGMRQRALIAMSLACKPRLLIADEPTTALDVTIQAQILELLRELVVDSGTSLIMITHDLGVIAGLCDSVNVMYSGRIVETASRYELFGHPRHPYTAGLLGSVPRLDASRGQPLRPIPGSPTDTLPWSRGCAFQPRCANRIATCASETPLLQVDSARRDGIGGPHWLRCFNPVASSTPVSAPGAPAAGLGASDGVPGSGAAAAPEADAFPPLGPLSAAEAASHPSQTGLSGKVLGGDPGLADVDSGAASRGAPGSAPGSMEPVARPAEEDE
jgi:peptide/nickel transport system ATP-binding protein